MIATALFFAAPMLNLEVGQAFEIHAQVDCVTGVETLDFNGAASTSGGPGGKKRISFLFMKKWGADTNKLGVLMIEKFASGYSVMQEVSYGMDYIPGEANQPKLSFAFYIGHGTYFNLNSVDEPKGFDWDYHETQVRSHGAVMEYKGTCKLIKKGPNG